MLELQLEFHFAQVPAFMAVSVMIFVPLFVFVLQTELRFVAAAGALADHLYEHMTDHAPMPVRVFLLVLVFYLIFVASLHWFRAYRDSQ